ncbi:hypothetical protein CC80DRAFT_405634 [Byssothecium circinans]|uniref:Uncharacterized protein n=1 Tax=Byssothecium circinans TaxID=147558 RepID=A0A6A5UAF3_9PLEO|nr:hypothetical protein CC80DRAFT_405634 [Byssothecium circinans]
MVSTNLHKRLTPASTNDSLSVQGTPSERSSKRIRIDDTAIAYAVPAGLSQSSSITSTPLGPRFFNPLATPPPSANLRREVPKVSLKLRIPECVPDVREKRQAASRKGAATRWAKQGKLQQPLPKDREIKAAYNLKLMRHYPAAPATNPALQPVIQKSERVAKLLKSFPKLETPVPTAANSIAVKTQLQIDEQNLKRNVKATRSDEGKKIAWASFSVEDWAERQVMVESALPSDDMSKESRGAPNNLPDWIKHKTSKFAQEEGPSVRGKKGRKWA